MPASLLSKKSVCIITGPTKGLGLSITKSLSNSLPRGSLFILLSRNEQLLEKVSQLVSSKEGIYAVNEVFHQDSRDQNVFNNILQKCLDKAKSLTDVTSFEQAILVNNAGTLEPLELSRNLDNLDTMASYFQNNIVGCSVLTAKFLQIFTPPVNRVIINITSLAAISPFKSWSLYCMAKAAREMHMKVIGQEEENIRTLSYAPGPIHTEMSETAAANTKDPELKKWFNDKIKENGLVQCDETVEKLIKILQQNSFDNGEHLDFYDI